MTIVDASVAIKWFVNEEGANRALKVLEAIEGSPRDFAVPEFFFNEMLSVLCRLEKNVEKLQGYLEDLQDLGLSRLGNGRETLKTAIKYAQKYEISGYDAIYVANAKLIGGVWLTADKKAHQKVASLKISETL